VTSSSSVVQEHPSEKGMYVYRMYGKFDDVTATEFLSVQLDMSDFRSIVLQSVQYWVSDPVPQCTAGYVRLSLHLGQ
jgi:hypothetical protein